jgi:hypothetical protein
MFAMKRVILAAVFIVAISGFAAAQTTSAKPTTKQQKVTVKKGPALKVNTNTVLKQEASANAKADTTVKLILPMPMVPADSTAMPRTKNDRIF